MSAIMVMGALGMTFAFLTYGIGCISIIRFRTVGVGTLAFFTTGLLFNIGAILLMMYGLRWEVFFTLHSLVGYLALILMAVNTIWVWRCTVCKGFEGRLGKKLLRYTKFAYLWWVLTYFLDIVIIIWK